MWVFVLKTKSWHQNWQNKLQKFGISFALAKFVEVIYRETLNNKTKNQITPMASKKYTLLLALLGLMTTASFAQTNGDASDAYVFDSSKVSVKNMPQYSEWKNNAYPYPAKPKDMWELGGGVGAGFILGDHPIFTNKYTGGITGNLSLRKSLGHTFSIRGSYSGSIISIPRHNKNSNEYLPYAKNFTHMVGLEALVALNNLRFYKGDPKTSIYLLGGYQLVATKVQTWKQPTGFNSFGLHTLYYPSTNLIGSFGGVNKSTNGRTARHAYGLFHAASVGGGIAFKLSPKFNLGLEQRFIVPIQGNDYLDGASDGFKSDIYSYSTIRLNMNLGNPATHVEPLWWKNPLNYLYNETNIPKHMKIVLPDADGDGVTDQFDLEPNTPAGAAVDSHGRALDTDGDGVPDYKDKEKLTAQNCFPVNADGVGTCPEPQCCIDNARKLDSLLAHPPVPACSLSSLPSVTFKGSGAKLSKDAQSILAGAASQLQANPTCNVKVVGYVAESSKRAQQLSYDRVNAVIKYLVEKGAISPSRIIFVFGQQGDAKTVDLQPTTETGPNTVPAPFPQYRTTK